MLAALGAALFALAHPASAQQPLIELTIDQCVALPGDDVRRVVMTELGAALTTDAEVPESGAPDWVVEATGRERVTRITVGCGTPRTLRISVFGASVPHPLDRHVELPADGRGAVRLLGLAIAELVQAAWSEPGPAPILASLGGVAVQPTAVVPVVPTEGRDRVDLPPETAPPSEPAVALRAGLATRIASVPALAAGLAIGMSHDLFPDWQWAVDLDYAHGEIGTALGSIAADFFSAAVLWQYRGRAGDVRMAAGLGARGLMVLRTPSPAPGLAGTQSLRYTGGPLIGLELEWRLARELSLIAGAELGWLVRALVGRAGPDPVATIDQGWARILLGAAWRVP
ncbi:MAG: hypothetical protein IT378_15845 [Sandaracinaceae bacterium]|nr:hypothetical protein [Sandaracinaceae bacterium]